MQEMRSRYLSAESPIGTEQGVRETSLLDSARWPGYKIILYT
jgi:hypothetical protein